MVTEVAEENDEPEGPLEIPIVGELGPEQGDLHEKLLEVEPGGECVLYFNSSGGDPYTALSLVNLIRYRQLDCTAVVTGECSSAAIWPFAACRRRIVAPLSVFLFHRCRWESEENIGFEEAKQWADHFERLSKESDEMLAQLLNLPLEKIDAWGRSGSYVTGAELVDLGCAEAMIWE